MNREAGTGTRRAFSAWVNREDKLVSFHPAEGCRLIDFSSREAFLGEILSMAQAGYRFQ